MPVPITKRAKELTGEQAFTYLELAAKARERGLDVISFGIGQPDFPTPEHIREAAKRALDKCITGYTPSGGLPDLREAIASWLNDSYGVDVKPEEVIVTAGAKAAIFASLMCIVDEGDEILIPDPSYPVYESVVRFLGGVPKPVPLDEEKDWALTVEAVENALTARTRALILNYPHNPTGSTLPPELVKELLNFAKKHNLVIISDEVYDRFLYEGRHETTLADPDWRDFVIYINGFSKTFSMTGWRLGFAVADKRVIERIEVAVNNMYSCPPSFAQVAAKEALEAGLDWFKPFFEEYKRRRDVLVSELTKLPGVKVVKPKGTFYSFPNVRGLQEQLGYSSVEKLVIDLLFDTGVLVLPGTAFPFNAGRDHIRVSFTVSTEKIKEGMKRFREWIETKS